MTTPLRTWLQIVVYTAVAIFLGAWWGLRPIFGWPTERLSSGNETAAEAIGSVFPIHLVPVTWIYGKAKADDPNDSRIDNFLFRWKVREMYARFGISLMIWSGVLFWHLRFLGSRTSPTSGMQDKKTFKPSDS